MNNGGPAFPRDSYTDKECGLVVTQNGMTLRDYFAAAAMQGLLANPARDYLPRDCADEALRHADAMLVARDANHE